MLNWLFYSPASYYGYAPPVQPTEPDHHVDSRLHSLELACAALWELLKQKNGYTDEELIEMIKQIDQRQAPQAPTLGGNAAVCPKCHHKMLTSNHAKCLWCGADLGSAPFAPS